MRKLYGILLVLVIITIGIPSVFSDVIKGDPVGEIEVIYSPGEFLRGWINISLEEVSARALISGYRVNNSLLTFLDNAGATYECSPNEDDCSDYFDATNPQTAKTFSVNRGDRRTIGLRLTGDLQSGNGVTNVSLDFSSDVGSSCQQPMRIDFRNDSVIDFAHKGSVEDFPPCSTSQGCFQEVDTQEFTIGSTQYCQNIAIPALPIFRIGADITKGTGNHSFIMNIYDYDEDLRGLGTCTIDPFDVSGEKSCIVRLNLTRITNATVCIHSESQTDYTLKGESNDTCGFFGLANSDDFTTDYDIFAKGGKFSPVGSVVINDESVSETSGETLRDIINEYLENEYDFDCENECIVPITLLIGEDQSFSIGNLTLQYETSSGSITATTLYDITERESLISMNMTRLDLTHAELSVPNESSTPTVRIKVDDVEIVEERISVQTGLIIGSITPLETSALVSTVFLALHNSSGDDITYHWDFGDGSEETTTASGVSHTYEQTGNYTLTLTATQGSVESKKVVEIKVLPPKDAINATIASFREKLSDVRSSTNTLPGWIKREFDNVADLDSLETRIDGLDQEYKGVLAEEDYIEIMRELRGIRIPTRFTVGQSLKQGDFILSETEFNLGTLEDFGIQTGSNPQNELFDAVNSWMFESFDAGVSADTYTLYYEDGTELDLFTHVTYTLTAKRDVSKYYFIVTGDPDSIVFSEAFDTTKADFAQAITTFDTLEGETRAIQVLYPEKIDLLQIPAIITPEFEDLSIDEDFRPKGPCNFNNICEEGENSSNCRHDCKPIFPTILLLLGLLLLAFIIYIILQEWYKRRYESSLFRTKNQLWNLINFISISKGQGLKKSKIFAKLKKVGWSTEQLNYAWRKYHGKRTGMWEIPIFKPIEKKKMNKELSKRKGSQQFGSLKRV